jgi:zinc transporter 7
MAAFAAGGILGDAFLHLLPHAIGVHGHAHGGHGHAHGGHDHDHADHGHTDEMNVGLCVLAGILTFFVMEKIFTIFGGGHSHSSKCDDGKSTKKKSKKKNKRQEETDGGELFMNIKPGAWVHLLGDFMHNITDGLAIGAAFAVSRDVGMSTTFATFIHEIPHELGDFAVLLQQGFTKKAAFLAQFVAATGAFIGCVFALLISNQQPAWLLSFTAGGFIYLGMVTVIPDLLQPVSAGPEGKSHITHSTIVTPNKDLLP